METSKVYYTDLRTSPTSNLLDKMERLVKRAGIEQLPLKDSFVAIKIHFGEPGNLAYLRPNYAARMANLLRNNGAKPLVSGKKLRVIKKASFDDTLITWPNQLLCPLKETV